MCVCVCVWGGGGWGGGGGEDSGDREEDVLIALVKCEFFVFVG